MLSCDISTWSDHVNYPTITCHLITSNDNDFKNERVTKRPWHQGRPSHKPYHSPKAQTAIETGPTRKKGTTHMSNYQCRKRCIAWRSGPSTWTSSYMRAQHNTSGNTAPGTQDQCLSWVSRPLRLQITGKPSPNVNPHDAPWLILLDPSDASVYTNSMSRDLEPRARD